MPTKVCLQLGVMGVTGQNCVVSQAKDKIVTKVRITHAPIEPDPSQKIRSSQKIRVSAVVNMAL